jgi:cell division protein FtsL
MMLRLNLTLLVALVASALYLVQVQYESRRLYAEIERAENEARKLEIEHERLQVEKRAQAHAGPRGEAGPRAAAHAPGHAGDHAVRHAQGPGAGGRAVSGRVVAYSSSPLLASRTPVWRSKFIVAGIALGFLALAGRAAWVQVFGNEFYRKQGEVRFARTLELPGQPRPHLRPQRPAARDQRAGAQHLGHPRGRRSATRPSWRSSRSCCRCRCRT